MYTDTVSVLCQKKLLVKGIKIWEKYRIYADQWSITTKSEKIYIYIFIYSKGSNKGTHKVRHQSGRHFILPWRASNWYDTPTQWKDQKRGI